jgi:hypothetical protein
MHVHNRGVGRQPVFRSAADRRVFLDCFARQLGADPATDSRGRAYKHFRGAVELAAYCLMPNHFHLLLRQGDDSTAVAQLMLRATTAYGRYFNSRHDRVGPLWQGRFSVEHPDSRESVMRQTAYIHLNMNDDPDYGFCSHQFYVAAGRRPDWLQTSSLLEIFGGVDPYKRFIQAELATRKRKREREAAGELDWVSL